MEDRLELRAALLRVLEGAAPLAAERVPLASAAGRVLAASVRARSSLPAWTDAGMDGYAVRAADVMGASQGRPVSLNVTESIAAGIAPAREVGPGEAARIMTGAPVPPGADSVIRVEDTDDGAAVVRILSDRDAGQNLRPAGEDVEAGAAALRSGTILGGSQLALLAALGERALQVRRRPRVALLASGDELVPLEHAAAPLRRGQVAATNSLALAAFLRADGAEPLDLGIAADSPTDIAERAARAAECDLLVTTGGASVGDHDHTRRALEAHGLDLHFWRVRVRPGAQTAAGRLRALGGVPWLGLPGNPVSAQVTYELFVRPLVRTLLGLAPFRTPLPVWLGEPIRASDHDTLLLRARLAAGSGGWRATLTGPQRSNLLHSMAHADALLVVPPGAGALPPGTPLHALPLGEGAFHSASVPW